VFTEVQKEIELEIAHVVFLDIVGYSKLSVNEQHARIEELNEIVRLSEQFRKAEAANRILKIPTGDGIALVFYKSPEEPAQCAVEISRALKDSPRLQIRMGIHSGPVRGVVDVNERANVAGVGINMAQRVMDCGDAGHILVSKHTAEDLEAYDHWRPLLHDLGTCEVKHGVRVSVTNLYSDEVGNPKLPTKLHALRKHRAQVRWAEAAIALLVLAGIIAAFIYFLRRGPASSLANVVEKSIAVLPFENFSDDKQNAYFTDGVQDEILTHLAKIADLKVISRTSVMQYKSGIARNLREIGQQLGVAHVLEGSVQRAGNKVRVNAQLIDARNDRHEWAENYDRPIDDVFAIQSEIAKAIADQLQAKLSPSEKKAIEQPTTTDLAAFDLYLRAQELFADTSDPIHAREKLPQAAQLLDEAVARDPHFLQAWCLLSRVHGAAYFRGHDHTPARLGLANAVVQTALGLQPDAGEAHLALAIYYYDGFRDYGRARSELIIARRALPNSADVFRYTGMIDRREGHWDEATRNLERALELDPRNFFTLQQLAYCYDWQHRYADEVRTYNRALAIMPGDPSTRINLALVALDWRADTKPLQGTLATLFAENPDLPLDLDALRLALCERPPTTATRALANYPHEGVVNNGVNNPRAYWDGVIARCQGDSAKAQAAFTTAREEVEGTVEKQLDFAAAVSLLGMIDAGLERKEQAIQEGRRACELLPVSKDAIDGVAIAINLAQIYAWTGEKDRAIEQIAAVERVPSSISYGLLKLHPFWDQLRGDPRFEKIVASLAPKQ
jgi:TolB-like protein/class 3 adenylate cyclase/Flp pilus assembly protein TadD